MTILSKLQDHRYWLTFFEYKRSGGHMSATDERALWQFIEKEEYVPVVEKICAGEPFPLPQMTILSKKDSAKKRVVYTMPSAENMVLKMMAWCLQEYDHLMAPRLYSFRRNIGVKKAIQDLISHPDIDQMYSYKLDIHDYFNAVNVERLLPRLREILEGEEEIYQFLTSLLRQPRAIYRWKVSQGKEDTHAIRAYIKYLDKKFFDNPVHNELTWCRWYLPIINTDETLRELDHYIQQNIRYLTTGRHTKANYRLRYETMQELGYRSLVNAYYQGRK